MASNVPFAAQFVSASRTRSENVQFTPLLSALQLQMLRYATVPSLSSWERTRTDRRLANPSKANDAYAPPDLDSSWPTAGRPSSDLITFVDQRRLGGPRTKQHSR
jgi:hypothetical protein